MINFGRVPPVADPSSALKAAWGVVTLGGSGDNYLYLRKRGREA
jgi:hypothetical protein